MKKTLLALALATTGAAALAGTVNTPTVVVNTMGEYGGLYPPVSAMLDQSGMSATYVSGVTDFATFVASGATHDIGDYVSWLSAERTYAGYLVLDLGATYTIANFVMWNGASGLSASVDQFSLETSETTDFTGAFLAGSFTGNQTFLGASVYDMTDSIGRYVKLTIGGNFGNPCCTAIGEIAFDVSPVGEVPEPVSLLLIGLGLGLAGAVPSRRGKRSHRA